MRDVGAIRGIGQVKYCRPRDELETASKQKQAARKQGPLLIISR